MKRKTRRNALQPESRLRIERALLNASAVGLQAPLQKRSRIEADAVRLLPVLAAGFKFLVVG